ncbi:MAG: alpha/beta hydrolase [Geminicoccaceae bacterium]|nr:alpha/beta hydrolase [Geminicoccaceae bacterium]
MPTLDPQMAAILKLMKDRALEPYTGMTPVEARRAQEERNAVWNEEPDAVARVENATIDGPFGPRRLRLYDPMPARKGASPAILYLHGGGWVVGSIDSHDVICRQLALRSGLIVAAYDYVLAPEHPFPQPLEDCLHAFEHLRTHASSSGIDGDRIGVAGDSAGASLALGLALQRRDAGAALPAALALVYPAVTTDLDRPSVHAFGGGDHVLSKEMMRWFTGHYLPDGSLAADPRVTLSLADLNGLPPVYLSVAEFDPLLDDGDLLLARLMASDTPLEYHRWRGVTHACLAMSRKLDRAARFQQEIADFFRRELAP